MFILPMPCTIKLKLTFSLANISLCSLQKKTWVLYNPAHQAKLKCWVQETCFLQTVLPPFGFSAYSYTLSACNIIPKTWTFTAQTRRLASDFTISLFDLHLINIAHSLKILSIKMSLVINGSSVNRTCGICKWLCLWCVAWSLVSYHMGGFSMSWTQKRKSLLWMGFLRVCAHASMLQWELALQ